MTTWNKLTNWQFKSELESHLIFMDSLNYIKWCVSRPMGQGKWQTNKPNKSKIECNWQQQQQQLVGQLLKVLSGNKHTHTYAQLANWETTKVLTKTRAWAGLVASAFWSVKRASNLFMNESLINHTNPFKNLAPAQFVFASASPHPSAETFASAFLFLNFLHEINIRANIQNMINSIRCASSWKSSPSNKCFNIYLCSSFAALQHFKLQCKKLPSGWNERTRKINCVQQATTTATRKTTTRANNNYNKESLSVQHEQQPQPHHVELPSYYYLRFM